MDRTLIMSQAEGATKVFAYFGKSIGKFFNLNQLISLFNLISNGILQLITVTT